MPTDDEPIETADTDPAPPAPAPRKKQRRGFAAMSAERQREIASAGGVAAHAKGRAHQWTPESAAAAGRIGGIRAQVARKVREATGGAK